MNVFILKMASSYNVVCDNAVIEEGYRVLESGKLDLIENLYQKVKKEVFHDGKDLFLKFAEHHRLLCEKKGLSRCYEADWCIPDLIRKEFIPLR